MATINGDEVLVKRGGSIRRVRDRRLSSAIKKVFRQHVRAKALEPEVREARGVIAGRAGDFLGGERGSVCFVVGGITLSVTPRYEAVIPEENVAEVRKILGRRFGSLVSVRKRYMGTRGLMDDERVGKLLSVKELSPSLRWEA
jgi:hypothetical protein